MGRVQKKRECKNAGNEEVRERVTKKKERNENSNLRED